MKITRNINGQNVEIELTNEELVEAQKECILNFYVKELKVNYADLVAEADAYNIAETAYELYLEGEHTEYECLEMAIDS